MNSEKFFGTGSGRRLWGWVLFCALVWVGWKAFEEWVFLDGPREAGISDRYPSHSLGDSVLRPTPLQGREAKIVSILLSSRHYRKLGLDDTLSARLWESYFEALDGNKMYFTKADLDSFLPYKYSLDDGLQTEDISVAFEIATLYRDRRLEYVNYVRDSLLLVEPDWTQNEDLILESKLIPRRASMKEIKDRWRKYVKNEMLSLKLAGKSWDETVSLLEKRYKRYAQDLEKLNSGDIFQVYLNTFTNLFDPHSSYFSPRRSEDFNISMSNSLEGIGARLSVEGDYVIITDLVPGGPAQKTGLLHAQDKIVGIAQEDDSTFVDIVGWRLDDVVARIRGPKDTVVRLEIIPHDALDASRLRQVRIVRDKIRLEDASAKKEIHEIEIGAAVYKFGVITIPSFYMDFEAFRQGAEDFASTSKDVARLLAELREEGIHGVLIDLRLNGGGALSEAVNTSGLFIPEGPVVLSRTASEEIMTYEDSDGELAYDGLLAVLVGRFSASASEIFAGAMKDYRRAFIFGERTYGKGTVQNLHDLSHYMPLERVGQVKMTVAKYYRVSGSSPQLRGILPDIIFPSPYDSIVYREISYDTALPWDQIQATTIESKLWVSEDQIQRLKEAYQEHVQTDEKFQAFIRKTEIQRKKLDRKRLSLSYAQRKKEQDEIREPDLPKEGALDKDDLLRESLQLMAVLVSED
ncbi:MAG: carboxy terminal-processing peptidase [Cytophagales bacterium]|nr:carboxy terminal-processing peptidase [Cytophagales bacterium]